MFFQGTLQEGITAALQQTKSVVCFVTDSGTESQQWEEDFLPNSEASSFIESQAVLLRLEAGSQEEGFLTQLYPIPKRPTIIIIKNGELKEYIAAGVTKDDFVRRVKAVLQPTISPIATPAQPEQAPTPSPTRQAVPRTAVSPTNTSSGRGTPSSSDSQTQLVPAEQPANNTNTHNRSTSTQSKRAEETSTQHHAYEESAETTTSSSKEAQVKQAELLKKMQNEAREERQRILKAIEDDKIDRQARKAELEAERLAAAAAANGKDTRDSASTSISSASTSKPRSSNGRLSETCAIQVRLLDGSTIRNRFSSTADTVQSIRKWVDEARTDGKTAYNFKILLTPLPSKAILATEESQSLRELKLAPSATLILVPAAGKKYTRPPASASASASASANFSSSSATTVTNNGPDDRQEYEEEGGNPFIQLINFLLGIINGFFGLISSFFTTLFSTAGPPQPADQPSQQRQQRAQASSSTTTGRAGGGSRIKGLERERQPEKRNDQQFYNGNSTNFEPRPDDKDE